MITLPVPSFVDRPLPYLTSYVLVLVFLCLWPFNFLQVNQVTWNPDGGLLFTPPATAYTEQPPAKLVGLREWTIVLDLKTLPPLRLGRILSYSLDDHNYNLNLDQYWDDLILRIRTGKDHRSREVGVARVADPTSERRFSLVITYDGQSICVYVDGQRKAYQKIGPIDYASWDPSYLLVLGSQANGENGWRGVFYRLAVIGRVVRPDELQNSLTNIPAALLCSFDEQSGMMTHDRSVTNQTPIIWPARFIPCARTILQSPRDYWPKYGRPSPSDIVTNILIYLPIGYLLASWFRRRSKPWSGVAVPVFIGFGLSLLIEIIQAYLPTRYSSTMDVITNTLGTIIGVFVLRKGWIDLLLRSLNISFRQSSHRQ